ncbi:MAG: carbohydrate-binding family 9-like protein [Odoribacter sp.]|nr:carbohydrate-binding family 9-like protein [Odoribacter sp.]
MYSIPLFADLDACRMQEAASQLEALPSRGIACNNWANDYPYAPQAEFRIAHNGEAIFIRFDVKENFTMAQVTEDNGEVWTDSCVEFFLSLDDSGYYNFEFTCIGKALAGFRKERLHATHGNTEVMQSIKRYSTLGEANFEEKTGDNVWTLTVAIPATALFKHDVKQLNGLKAKANVYKCGDNLSKPHFLSWQPIDTPTPNFHVPQFFTEIEFQG